MCKRLSNSICVAVVCALIVGGCAPESGPKADVLAVGPKLEALAVPSEYAALAIRAAGGFDAWANAKKIDLDCVATFYQEDGTYYLTEQRYEVFPWSNSVRISGAEPGGEYSRRLLEGRFSVLEGKSQYDGLQVGVDNGCIADGILNLITAPARLLDESVKYTWSTEPVRIKGQWYRPVKRLAKIGAPGTVNVREGAFYQKRSSGRVDMVLLGCGGTEDVLIVRGHDYRLLGKGGVMVPSKIEAFKADASNRVRHRIIEIDLK
ncbi:MAG: hypothetical protein ISS79_01875 [Phycisphaerae bacterium]|nr:hypothetical protein [Phycisphaerae bacterium]